MQFKSLRTQVQKMQSEIQCQNNQMKHLIDFLKKNGQSTSRLHLKSSISKSPINPIQSISPIQNNQTSQTKMSVDNQETTCLGTKINKVKNCTQQYNKQKAYLNYTRPYNLSKSIGKCHSCKLIQSVTPRMKVQNPQKTRNMLSNSKPANRFYKSKSQVRNIQRKNHSTSVMKKQINNISKNSVKQNDKWRQTNIKKNLKHLFQKRPNKDHKIKISMNMNTSREKLNLR